MKKFLFITTVVATLSACSTTTETQPVYNYTNNNCCSTSYTVSKPVEVVYQKTTYTTVYEPKTYSKTYYETQPYSCVAGQLCK